MKRRLVQCTLTDARRVRVIRDAGAKLAKTLVAEVKTQNEERTGGSGPVVYWCERDKRVEDNWALLYASEVSRAKGVGLAVCVSLSDDFWVQGARHSKFALEGLRDLEAKLKEHSVPLFLLQGEAGDVVPSLLRECGAGMLVCDFSPLRAARQRLDSVVDASPTSVAVHQVDAHNVVPLWVASDKQEYAARTIRPKINRVMHEWLVDIPALPVPAFGQAWDKPKPCTIEWDVHIRQATASSSPPSPSGGGASPPPKARPLRWCTGGETAGKAALEAFLSDSKRLSLYETSRNDPNKPSAQSNLSPWLNFGFLSAQRAALSARKLRSRFPKSVDGYIEELVIRRELADNFCYYCEHYDSIAGASAWAQESLAIHAKDKRDHVYTLAQFDAAKTHDDLWNAAQLELVYHGKMHGFMRMYWAKKILEWSESPQEALRIAIYLNDAYVTISPRSLSLRHHRVAMCILYIC